MTSIKKNENNFIDQRFQAALFPLNLFQNVFFQSNYTIKNNFVYRPKDMYFKKMFDLYITIMESFDLFKMIFQVPFTGILLELYVLGWMFKNIYLLSLCIKECENFYEYVIEAEIQCMLYFENKDCEGMKRLYKNIRRLNRTKFSKMTAFRIFTVDAALPLRYVDLFAVYTIVILQFAFQ
nr:uncharacterized protein LOC113401885 [Vanessa tameamea]